MNGLCKLFLAVTIGLLVGVASPPAQAYGYHGHHRHFHHFGHHHRFHRHRGVRYGVHAHGGGDLALGLFAGTLLGYVIGSHSHYGYHRERYYYYPREYYYPSYHYYRPYGYRTVVVPEVYYRPSPSPGTADCLQQREYQTIVTIGGEQVRAWGIACLQADGSWRRGGINY